jgi:sRNA-binding regulator protein Hfq
MFYSEDPREGSALAEPAGKKIRAQAEAKPKEPPERPEVAQFLKWKRNGTRIHWQLLDGSTVIGALNWFDNYTVQVQTDIGDMTIPKHALLWYREVAEP